MKEIELQRNWLGELKTARKACEEAGSELFASVPFFKVLDEMIDAMPGWRETWDAS